MYTGKKYPFKSMVWWTRKELFAFLVISASITILYDIVGFDWLKLPSLPIALVGTAVAFIVGFQNNVTYSRIWEARIIWDGISTASRSWAIMVQDMITNEYALEKASDGELESIKKTLIYRHLAWVTALRYAMRKEKSWEVFKKEKTNKEWYEKANIPERDVALEEELKKYLAPDELEIVLKKVNVAAAIQKIQSNHLRKLKEKGILWEFSFLELENSLKAHMELQGKSERIKNFPYPRQYATLNNYFVWILIAFLPFAIVPAFAETGIKIAESFPLVGKYFVWLSIPFYTIVSWVFHTMERIGRTGDNPFEGSANDVPISTISRSIEIDLRELLEEEDIPQPLEAFYGVQM